MLSFEQTNVMSLIGVCLDGDMPLLIMPFMSKGSVLDYVRHNKDLLLGSQVKYTFYLLDRYVCVSESQSLCDHV